MRPDDKAMRDLIESLRAQADVIEATVAEMMTTIDAHESTIADHRLAADMMEEILRDAQPAAFTRPSWYDPAQQLQWGMNGMNVYGAPR